MRDNYDTKHRLVRIETKVSKLMQYLNVPVQEHDKGDLLTDAYDLIAEFEHVIQSSLDNDRPYAAQVDKWLTQYEKLKGIN